MDDEKRVGRVMTDFLLELRSEEIPARMQLKAKDDLVRLFTDALTKAGLAADAIEAFATPRRLALIAKGLPLETAASSEETKGPKVGAPPQAMEGFLRKTGLTQDQLVERDGVYFAIAEKPGRNTADVLAEAIPAIIRAFPWPKSQRWGAASVSTESLRWVRPLQGIIALLGNDVVDCEIDGIISGRATMGHRFHSTGPIEIANTDGYVEALRAAQVIVHFSERTAIIRDGAEAAARAAGLVLVPDEGLVTENAGLTEWPVPMLGRFDPAFLAVPQEVIQLTARVNQKYFVCNDSDGKLANAFVCTANIVAHDGGAAIVAGNEKVLAARLSDAKFFWEQDLKKSLLEHSKKLANIVFHEKLGSMLERTDRIGTILGELVSDNDNSEKIVESSISLARMAKADLVTEMVGEFPELQGTIGGYYAFQETRSDAISTAISEHYRPLGPSDPLPSSKLASSLALADKMDTLVGFFAIGLKPSGSKDPFALRRATLSICRIVLDGNEAMPLKALIGYVMNSLLIQKVDKIIDFIEQNYEEVENVSTDLDFDGETGKVSYRGLEFDIPVAYRATFELVERFKNPENLARIIDEVFEFIIDRLKIQQREAGVRHDLIDAVFALGGEDDLVRLLARVKALQAFVATQEGADLLAGYKRAANILRQSPSPLAGEGRGEGADASASQTNIPAADAAGDPTPNPLPQGERALEEVALLNALNTAEPLAASAIEAEHFEDAMAALASLRAPIDAFFDGVMVNDPDPEKRAFRVGLLTRFRDAVCQVADFSRIEG